MNRRVKPGDDIWDRAGGSEVARLRDVAAADGAGEGGEGGPDLGLRMALQLGHEVGNELLVIAVALDATAVRIEHGGFLIAAIELESAALERHTEREGARQHSSGGEEEAPARRHHDLPKDAPD